MDKGGEGPVCAMANRKGNNQTLQNIYVCIKSTPQRMISKTLCKIVISIEKKKKIQRNVLSGIKKVREDNEKGYTNKKW